jgi:antitoxin component of RelBE/YafQ-DinJ toxin-antitoxin module
MGASAAIAVMRMREDQVIRAFRTAGATSTAAALAIGELGLDDSRAVKRLRTQAILREAEPGKLYLDEEVLTAVRRRRLRMVWLLVVILALLLGAMRLGLIKP